MTEHATMIKRMEQAGEDTSQELEKLYFDNLNFVRKVGRPFTAQQELDDLEQEGYFALVKAVAYFDPAKGGNFTTIYGKFLMTQFSRMNDGRAYIPYNARETARKFDKLTKDYISSHGEEPPKSYYLDHMTAREIDTARTVLTQGNPASIYSTDAEHGDTPLVEYLPDTSEGSVEDIVVDTTYKEELKSIWKDVDELTTPEQSRAIKAVFLEGKSTREAGKGKYVAGLERLKKQKRRFTPYLERIRDDAIYNEGVKTVSVSRFHQEGISSTERAAFMMIETFEKARMPIPEKYTPYIKGYKQLIEKLG